MFSKKELLDAIAECEKHPKNYHDCEKLATFYQIYDHLYPDHATVREVEEETVAEHGDSEFLKAISGMDADKVWKVMDELLNTIKVMQPRLYDGVLQKISQS